MQRRNFVMGSVAALGACSAARSASATLRVLLTDGQVVYGSSDLTSLQVRRGESQLQIRLRDVRSFHSGAPASESEAARISRDLPLVGGKDAAASETALANLVAIGLPVLTPLLSAYKDVDAREPKPLYRLFSRLVPGYADHRDRSLDLIRLAGSKAVRGKLALTELRLEHDGKQETIPGNRIRTLAPVQPALERDLELHSLYHCTYVSFLDTGLELSPTSRITSEAEGFVRLDFNEDGWSSDPDGIVDPLPGKRRLQEGFRWGAILGRVGPTGERFLMGSRFDKSAPSAGRLHVVINDNPHWQNNIGSYRMHLKATHTYDLGDAQ